MPPPPDWLDARHRFVFSCSVPNPGKALLRQLLSCRQEGSSEPELTSSPHEMAWGRPAWASFPPASRPPGSPTRRCFALPLCRGSCAARADIPPNRKQRAFIPFRCKQMLTCLMPSLHEKRKKRVHSQVFSSYVNL